MAKLKVRSSALKPATRKTSRSPARTSHSLARDSKKSSAKTTPEVAGNGAPASSLGVSANGITPLRQVTATEVAEKVKELVRLAQEQGYLTYGDINDVLPDNLVTADDLDEIYQKLRNLEIEKI